MKIQIEPERNSIIVTFRPTGKPRNSSSRLGSPGFRPIAAASQAPRHPNWHPSGARGVSLGKATRTARPAAPTAGFSGINRGASRSGLKPKPNALRHLRRLLRSLLAA